MCPRGHVVAAIRYTEELHTSCGIFLCDICIHMYHGYFFIFITSENISFIKRLKQYVRVSYVGRYRGGFKIKFNAGLFRKKFHNRKISLLAFYFKYKLYYILY